MMLAMHPMLTGLMPEITLVIGASAILLASPVTSRSELRSRADTNLGSGAFVWLALLSVAGALHLARGLSESTVEQVAGLNQDSLLWYTRLIGLSVGGLILLVNRHVPEPHERGEFFALILFSIAGVLLVAAANNLILLFMGLELVSVPTYILVGLSRRDIRAQEATGKYFFLGAFAAAIMLYGFSFLYGAAGTMQLFPSQASQHSIYTVLSEPGAMGDTIIMIGALLVLAGLAFKVAAVPLHFYVADVYQGAASPVTGLLGFIPKFAGFVALVRLFWLFGWSYGDAMFWLLWAMAAVTMFVGNTLALMQHNVKRMLAYSSVAHSGYMLVALVAGPGINPAGASPMRNGVTAMLFYIAVYGVMNLGAFAALSFFRKQGEDGEDSVEMLDDLAGAARRHPWASLALAVCVMGLMGFPLTGGFLGKLYVFSAALSATEGAAGHQAMIVLVVIAVLNSAIAAAYYLRILATCYLKRPADDMRPSRCQVLRVSMALCAIIVVTAFFRPSVFFDEASQAGAWRPWNNTSVASLPVSTDASFDGETAGQ